MNRERQHELLRRFEPVMRFTKGEQFFPIDAERYLAACSLWAWTAGGQPKCVVPRGQLSLDRLRAAADASPGSRVFLKFVDPLPPGQLALYALQRHQQPDDIFRAGRGRLARVGYVSRFVDALFSITLLARGRVPGDRAAAATIAYRQIMEHQPSYQYYGRVVCENGWTVLQYWFLYAFNNWRSGFFGANDHEADWEMICVYLSESASGEVNPEWVAYAAHDYAGDDLRRRWDDPELEKVGEHPIVYVAAGSHASYFARGEYLTELELRFLMPIARITDRLQTFWHEQLRQYRTEPRPAVEERASNIFRIPFVDYARGDGLSIGPAQRIEWAAPLVLDPPPTWLTSFRGLWGLYTRDPFAGEDAPAGPMYNRSGTVRRSWYDPVGWVGLDKVVPQPQAMFLLAAQHAEVAQRQAKVQQQIAAQQRELQALGLELAAMRGQQHLSLLLRSHRERISQLSRELGRLRAQASADHALKEALSRYAACLKAGERGPVRGHLHRPRQPTPHTHLRLSRVAETWAALSVG